MTTVQSRPPIGEDDVRGFAAKAQAWAETLSPQEQTILGEMFRRAAEEPADDVAGHSALNQPPGSLGWTPSSIGVWAAQAAFRACATGKHIPDVRLTT